MGLFNIIGDVVGAGIKVASTPITIVKDVISNGVGIESNSTKKLLESAGDDLRNAADEIMP
jgi:hypothetical protein